MTKGRLFFILLLVAAVVVAVFVWPTRYRYIESTESADGPTRPMRVDRITSRVEMQNGSGEWVEHVKPPKYEKRETYVDHGVSQARQAGEDIRKMNQAAKDAVDNGTLGK